MDGRKHMHVGRRHGEGERGSTDTERIPLQVKTLQNKPRFRVTDKHHNNQLK